MWYDRCEYGCGTFQDRFLADALTNSLVEVWKQSNPSICVGSARFLYFCADRLCVYELQTCDLLYTLLWIFMLWDVVAKLSCDRCWEASERRTQAWGLGPITKIWYESSSCNWIWSKCFVACMLVVIFRYIQVNLTWHSWLYIIWTWSIQIDKGAKYSQFYFLCQLQSCWNCCGWIPQDWFNDTWLQRNGLRWRKVLLWQKLLWKFWKLQG